MHLESGPAISEATFPRGTAPPAAADHNRGRRSETKNSHKKPTQEEKSSSSLWKAQAKSADRIQDPIPQTQSKKRNRSDDHRKSTRVTIPAQKRKLSMSPLKKDKLIHRDIAQEPDTDEVVAPTLDEEGRPTRIPDEQCAQFVGGPGYPITSLKRVMLRDMKKDLGREIADRGDFAHFCSDDIIKTSQYLLYCGVNSPH